MNHSITRTKIVTPRRRQDLLSRPRLLDVLIDQLDRKLIIVIAPAGYGKTSILVDLADQVELPVCWYTVDPLDRDPQRFIAHLIASVERLFPTFGAESVAALRTLAAGQATLDQLIITIVNELYEQVQEHFLLVVDDYHLTDEHPEIDRFVSQFVQQVDENCHLILASRRLLTLPDLPLMVARSQVGGIGFEDLAFQADEIQALLQHTYNQSINDTAALDLVNSTEGWITGLLLSAQTMKQGLHDRSRLMRTSGVSLYDYLAQQVLEQQLPEVREFLLRTSMLEEFDVALCEAVIGPDWHPTNATWQDLINIVLQNNLFVLPVEEEETWLRYHHLFREFLQQRLEKAQPNVRLTILRRLADVYMESKEWEKAHHTYQQLGDLHATADLIERASFGLLQQFRIQLLANWLDTLPTDFFALRPGLLSIKGYIYVIQGSMETGISLSNKAIEQLRTTNALVPLATALVYRTVAYRSSGNYGAALLDIDETINLFEKIDESTYETQAIYAMALKHKGLCLQRIGKLNESLLWLNKSLDGYTAISDAQNIASVAMEIATVHLHAGQLSKAQIQFQHALDSWRNQKNIARQAVTLNNLGVLYHLQGNYKESAIALQDALICAERSGYTRMTAFALTSLGDLCADLGLVTISKESYQRASEVARRIEERFLLLSLELSRTSLAGLEGDWSQAYERLDAAGQLVLEERSDFEWGLYRLAMGRYYLAQNRNAEAIVPLQDAAECFAKGGQSTEEAIAHLYLATTFDSREQSDKISIHLRKMFTLIENLESIQPLIVAAYRVQETFKLLVNDKRWESRISLLLEQLATFRQTIPSLRRHVRETISSITIPLSNMPPKLVIQTLGRVEVRLSDKLISGSDWKSQVARDLFLCILAHPHGLTKEEIGEFLWPDSTPAQLKTRFKNAIYRLRTALTKGNLNQDVILFEDDLYKFNQALDYEYDVELFLDKISDARIAADLPIQIATYQDALTLYRGDYLADVDATWAWSERERLQNIYLDSCLDLSTLYMKDREYNMALAYSQQILSTDNCREDAHRLVMQIHSITGNRAAIVRQYEQCQQALLDELDVSPSPQTETLYLKLIQ